MKSLVGDLGGIHKVGDVENVPGHGTRVSPWGDENLRKGCIVRHWGLGIESQ